MLYPETLRELTESYNLGYEQASSEEIQVHASELFATHNSNNYKREKINEDDISKREFFKVSFITDMFLWTTETAIIFVSLSQIKLGFL